MNNYLSAILFTAVVLFPQISIADEDLCGAPPSLPVTKEAAETIKGDLQGKADFLSKLVGQAQLAGEIEAARKTIYQDSDKFFAAQKDAYLSHLFCVIIAKDTTLSTMEKIKALQEYRNSPVSQNSNVDHLTNNDSLLLQYN